MCGLIYYAFNTINVHVFEPDTYPMPILVNSSSSKLALFMGEPFHSLNVLSALGCE